MITKLEIRLAVTEAAARVYQGTPGDPYSTARNIARLAKALEEHVEAMRRPEDDPE